MDEIVIQLIPQYKRNIKLMSTFALIQPTNPNQNNSHQTHPTPKQQIKYFCEQFSVLQVHGSNIIHCLEVYAWRFKTYLPIAKATHYVLNTSQQLKIQNEQNSPNRFHTTFQKLGSYHQDKVKQAINYIKNHPQIKTYDLYVKIQKIKFELKDIDLLPLPQILYLLKEMMIGYEVLVDIFGMFQPNDAMVMINEQDQWKIWISNILQSTQLHNSKITQKQFIYRLVLIAENHCVVNHLSKRFFASIKQLTYRQECTFVKVIEQIKHFTNVNKIFNTNKVVFEGNYSPLKTLTKKKGYYRLEQMRSSFVDGKFIPKQQYNVSSQYFSSQSQISPQKKVHSIKTNETPQTYRDLKSAQTNDKYWSNSQFYTPRQRINSTARNVYSPQLQAQTQNYFTKKMINSFPSTLLNNTISNSIIQKRRKSDQINNFDQKYKVTNQNQSQFKCNVDIIRQIKYQNQTKPTPNACKDSKTMNNDSFSHISIQKLKDSIRTDNPYTPNYSNLKKNDLDYNFKNLQNSYLNFSMHHHQKEDKSLTVSHHFGNIQKGTPNQNDSSQKSSQTFLKNTISGLFSNSAPIRQLKTSIKIKSPEQIQQQQKYLSGINLQLLSKMGRHAKESFINQEQSSTAPHIEQNMAESCEIKQKNDQKCTKTLRDSQQESTLLKSNKPTNEIVIGKNCVFRLKNNNVTPLSTGQCKFKQQ